MQNKADKVCEKQFTWDTVPIFSDIRSQITDRSDGTKYSAELERTGGLPKVKSQNTDCTRAN